MMKFSFAKAILIAIFATLMTLQVQNASARAIPALEGLEALRRGFSNVLDFTADITQEKRISLMKRPMVMTGTVRFKKPDLFLMEINPPFSSRMLLRDGVIEQSTGKGMERNRIVLPPEQGLKRWFSKLATPVASLPDGLAIQADLTNSVYTLTITPQGKGQVKDILIVFMEDGAVRKFVITEQNGDRATMTLKKVRRNTGLSEQDFRLE